jgi:hypothetical protein
MTMTTYILCIDEADAINWPTLTLPKGEAVPIFTTAERAEKFKQAAQRWSQYEVKEVSLPTLLAYLRDCLRGGIKWVATDPDGGKCKYTLLLKFLAQADPAPDPA